MWVLREFQLHQLVYNQIVQYSFHDICDWFLDYNIKLVLVNTETGETVDLSGDVRGLQDTFDKLKAYSPYGFGVSRLTDVNNSGNDYYYMLGVSDMSYKFLDLVKKVEVITEKNSNKDAEFVRWWDKAQYIYTAHNFVAVDDACSLFKFTTYQNVDKFQPLCTLLEVMMFCQVWWYGDDFYIFVDSTVYKTPLYYKVSFYDVKRVKSFVLKAAMLYNGHLRGAIKKLRG